MSILGTLNSFAPVSCTSAAGLSRIAVFAAALYTSSSWSVYFLNSSMLLSLPAMLHYSFNGGKPITSRAALISAFLSLPALIGQVITSFDAGNEVGAWLTTVFSAPSASNYATMYPDGITGQWFVYPIMYFLLVFAFTYFYTSIIFNTKEIADNLQKQGGFIEGVRPGGKTAEYLSKVVRRLDLFGALALGLIAMLPFATDYIFILTTGAPLGLSISGTGLLIVVTVALENLRSVDSRALMITYDDFGDELKD